jgi:hypothetical protein
LRKATTWTLRAAGLLLPLVWAVGAGADQYCSEVPGLRTVWSADYSGDNEDTCFYTCSVTSRTELWCWTPDDREPPPYYAAAAADASSAPSDAVSFTADPVAVSCGLTIIDNGDASETYTVSKEKPKGDGKWGSCEASARDLCCVGWYGPCEYD